MMNDDVLSPDRGRFIYKFGASSAERASDGRKLTWYVYTAFIKLKQGHSFAPMKNEDTTIPKVCSKKPMGW